MSSPSALVALLLCLVLSSIYTPLPQIHSFSIHPSRCNKHSRYAFLLHQQISPPQPSSISHDTKVTNTKHRFNITSSINSQISDECILTINGIKYDVQSFALAHPGGPDILRKFHNKPNATAAFEKAGHSKKAYELLERYAITKSDKNETLTVHSTRTMSLWRQKLFTHEDPGIHKYLGLWALLHFVYRYWQIFFGDTTAGFGCRRGIGASAYVGFWLIPHAALNLSSFIFNVPRARIVGKPIIWKEYRVHNLIFVMRSIICTVLCWLSIYHKHLPRWRQIALIGSSATILGANYAADEATKRLQPAQNDSSVASLPFWEGCTLTTQRRVKKFYAYCQFMATIACFTVTNPIWPFAVLMPIQMSSILLTLVRKSIISARGFHVGYFISLLFPFAAALKHFVEMKFAIDVPLSFAWGTVAFLLRCRGVDKYLIWGSTAACRIGLGDRIMNYQIW